MPPASGGQSNAKASEGRSRRKRQAAAYDGDGGRASGGGGGNRLSRWLKILVGLAVLQAIGGLVMFRYRSGRGMGAGQDGEDHVARLDQLQKKRPELQLPPGVLEWPSDQAAIANLSAFADPWARQPGLQQQPSDIAVLLIASGVRPASLRRCLRSLKDVSGFDAANVVVSQASPGTVSRDVAALEFGVAWVGPTEESEKEASRGALPAAMGSSTEAIQSFAMRRGPTSHYRRSLQFAVNEHQQFADSRFRSLLVLHEDQVFSGDMLWYFSQLEAMLHEEATSLFCVSGWNDNGQAAFVGDPTVVLRTDYFSGVGWLMRMDTIRKEFVRAKWENVETSWRQKAREVAAGRHCLIPEISRVGYGTAVCRGTGLVGECGDGEVMARRASASSPIYGRDWAALGDTARLRAATYRELLGSSWPGMQGLRHSRLVKSFTELEDVLGHASASAATHEQVEHDFPRAPLLVIVTLSEAGAEEDPNENHGGHSPWKSVAGYFGLPETAEPRGSYDGVLRLRWRDFTLYIALESSPLLREYLPEEARSLAEIPMFRGSDFAKRLRAAQTGWQLSHAVPPHSLAGQAPQGVACDRYCEKMQRICIDADIGIVAKCGAPLMSAFQQCRKCQEPGSSMGFSKRKYPEEAAAALPGLDRDRNVCLAAAAPLEHTGGAAMPGDCAAASKRIKRLCICRRNPQWHGGGGGLPAAAAKFLYTPARFFQDEDDDEDEPARGRPQEKKSTTRRPLRQGVGITNVSRFASPSAASPPRTEVQPADLAILVLAPTSRRHARWDLAALEETLNSLSRTNGFNARRVLVAHDDGQLRTVQLIGGLGCERTELPDAGGGGEDKKARMRLPTLYEHGLRVALVDKFPEARTLIVVEEI
eukprot:TRINITY_DN33938_c0_g2_i2.p1 TRINITY_DN33938_c0_g2~~TRINITY_DN33938_c0_g2_i2.p1  ORF type:complete len:875 (+),score=207.02 TRINITY_DN33938_c0_g2_i2:91-2715(+)